jgi:GT2 family glycosyltransferase
MQPPVTVCVLFYGDHVGLCDRFFTRLFRHTQPEFFELRIGLNAVCQRTADFVAEFSAKHPNTQIYRSERNIYKDPMMRRMFYPDRIGTRWTIWFDDDSYATRPDWLAGLAVTMRLHPEIDMFGDARFVEVDDSLFAFIRRSPWFRGLDFEKRANGTPIINFITGGFWALRTECIYALNWPDPRIIQLEEDYVLGEALRQNGYRIREFTSGVEVNAGERRVPPGAPSSY